MAVNVHQYIAVGRTSLSMAVGVYTSILQSGCATVGVYQHKSDGKIWEISVYQYIALGRSQCVAVGIYKEYIRQACMYVPNM